MQHKYPLDEDRWNYIFWLLTFVIFFSILLTIIPQEIKDEDYDKQLRFARSLGIASATLCLIFAKNTLNTEYSGRILWMAFFQILIFSIYILISILKRRRNDASTTISNPFRINNLQLCMITTSLLIGCNSKLRDPFF